MKSLDRIFATRRGLGGKLQADAGRVASVASEQFGGAWGKDVGCKVAAKELSWRGTETGSWIDAVGLLTLDARL